MALSPAHYRYFLDFPVEETDAMRVGSYAHHLALGGPGDFAVWTGGGRRGKEWETFVGDVGDETTIVTLTQAESAKRIADAAHAEFERHHLVGKAERKREWVIGGRSCQGTPDLDTNDNAVVELKVVPTAHPDKFPWHARRMGYIGQLGWYAHALGSTERYIVAVEAKPPHFATTFVLTAGACEEGDRTWRLLWERLMVCEASDEWPCYVQGLAALDGLEELTLDFEEAS